ncbi:AmmeMemoRadiSam system protein B [Natronogracilivirga saccharolytica]|uniref:AmmeMemoRadiSam system protein B n=1 Tax=Natronogracilivirga saccharolytica TaxID=2812953 RepID=A0A8J7RNE1_9BACT|nr:AmmeMemoRadiSam system protein B [Natronogracilivirga saccharolytica]MBP3192919.1 AmmeMemoRadiSam system protein B [Natronogracilivirga saccharolytica]
MIHDHFVCERKLPFTNEELKERMASMPYCGQDGLRMLFLPPRMTTQNADEFCFVYRQIMDTDYDTIVIIEPDSWHAKRKIQLLAGRSVETPSGPVPLDERLRDDFCDEEDDFYIREDADVTHLGFFDHLQMLQLTQNDFSVVGMQLMDESPPIVQELTFVLKEIMPFKNGLIVFCCEMPAQYQDTFDKLTRAISEENDTRLNNLIYSGESHIHGAGVFLSGVMAARYREREIRFYRTSSGNPDDNLLSAHAGFPDR